MQGLRNTVLGLGLSGLMVLSAGTPVLAQGVSDLKNTIITQGQGEVRVQPDSFQIDFAVETTAKTVAEAREQNARQMQRIVSALKGLNLPGMKLETRNVNVYPIYDERRPEPVPITTRSRQPEPPQVVGYRFNNTLNVRVTDAPESEVGELASRVMGTALDAGANQMQSLNFYLDNMSPVRRQALMEAVNEARLNAAALAEAAGVTLDGVHSIEGTPQYGYIGQPYRMQMSSMKGDVMEAAAPIPVEPGEMTVNSNVTVRFTFR